MTKKNIILVAPGFEETEMVITLDVLRRLDLELAVVATDRLDTTSSHELTIQADCLLAELDFSDVALVITPGGMPGSLNLMNNKMVLELIRTVHAAGGTLASICASPIVLAAAGVLKNVRYTCYPGFEKEIADGCYTGSESESDNNIITARGPGASFAFAARIAASCKVSEEKIKACLDGMFVC